MPIGATADQRGARRRPATWAIATLIALALCSLAAPAAFARRAHGTWQNPEALMVTSLNPVTGAYAGSGRSDWQGTFRGTTTFTTEGTTNLITGATVGTVDETFTGQARGGLRGTMRFLEEFTIAAFTGDFHLVAHLKSGTRDFKGAQGRIVFVGTSEPITGISGGTYAGRWRIPRH